MCACTADSLKVTLLNELRSVQCKAYKLGIQLGILDNRMKELHREDDLLAAVINEHFNNNGIYEIVWRGIVRVLRKNEVGESKLAETIEKKYCYKQHKG